MWNRADQPGQESHSQPNSMATFLCREQLLCVLLEVCEFLLSDIPPKEKDSRLAGQLVGSFLQVSSWVAPVRVATLCWSIQVYRY